MLHRYKYLILPVLITVSACSLTAEKSDVHNNLHQINLPVDIQDLLRQEMQAIEQAMQKLISSIATADWQKTVAIAEQIQASYILQQNISADQKRTLQHLLPEQFKKLDQAFHHHAGMLAHAAKAKNADVVNFYFYKLSDSCVQCHSNYARSRFPGFSNLTNHHTH